MASKPIYQIYAELDAYKPIIWRRFLVLNNISMAKLGYIVMTMFEMKASHLFSFDIPVLENLKIRYAGIPDENNSFALEMFEWLTGSKDLRIEALIEFSDDFMGEVKIVDAKNVKLVDTFIKKNEVAIFNYDYGDGWRINIIIEKIFTDDEIDGKELPHVISGEGLGIIEDCGGTFGLAKISKAYKKRSGSEYKKNVKWLGITDLDLTFFDIDDMNFRLKKIPRIYANIYEKELVPTKRSIDLIERKYLKSDK